MPRYMIELPFSPEYCMKAMGKVDQWEIDFLPSVYWGCTVEKQRGWSIVEASSESEARNTVPEAIRNDVEITEIKTLTPELIQAMEEGSIEKAA